MLVVAFVFSAFVALPSSKASPAGPSPRAAPVLRVGELQQPDSLNIFVGVESASYIIWAHVYELLVGIGPDLTSVPALAKSWEVDQQTQTIWTFHLQNNATWHDGAPFTSADVNFTFRYIYKSTPYNQDNATTYMGCDLTLLEGYLGDYDKRIGVDVGNITTPDPYTVVIPTYQPKANILSMFIQILPWHIWRSIPCRNVLHVNPTPVIGTGMYKFTAWQKGAYVQLDLNQGYWRLNPAEVNDYVPTILIEYYQNAATMYNDLTNGLLDATDALTAQQFLALEGTAGFAFYAQRSLSMTEMGACVASDGLIADWGVKGGRNWLVTNRTIRQAMQLAVNRSFLVDSVLGPPGGAPGSGLGLAGSTLIPPGTPLWHLNISAANALDNRIEDARQLLSDPDDDGMTVLPGHNNDPGPYGQWLDPGATNNQDAFGAIDPAYPNIRVPLNPSRVRTGDEWGDSGGETSKNPTSAPNRPAPYPLIFTLDVINTAQESSFAADIMVQWWASIGISVTKSLISESKMISVTYACSEDFYMWGWGMDVDPNFALSVMTTAQILYWQDAWYSNLTYDAKYALQQTQVDPYQRQATIWWMQNKVYYDAAYLIVWYPDTLTVVSTDRFTGWNALGDWETHSGLGLTGFGNDLVMLGVRGAGAPPPVNNCPTTPVLTPSGPVTAFVGTNVSFTGTASDPDAADTLTWTWSWGDANSTQNRTGGGTNVQVSQVYKWARPGTYDVNLTVSDGLCPKTATTQVQIVALPADIGWIAGTVTDAATQVPLVGASVVTSPGNYFAPTGSAGQYNMTVPTGTYAVTASRNLYLPSTETGVVVAKDVTATVDFALTSTAGWIAGTVTATGAGPLQAAAVYAVSGTKEYSTSTNAQGAYNLSVPAGTYKVNASKAGYITQEMTGQIVQAGETTTVSFALDPVPTPPPTEAGLSTLAIAAIVGVVVVAAVAAAAVLLLRRRTKAEEIEAPMMPPPKPPGSP